MITSHTCRYGEPRSLNRRGGDAATYLQLAPDESADDPTEVPRVLGVIARSQNMSDLARRVGMSRDGLYAAFAAEGNPTWATVLKVINALGLRLILHHVA